MLTNMASKKSSPPKATAVAQQPAPKRTRRSRDEGKQLLLDAAQQLLLKHAPDEIGIRDVGTLAGVHHRFVMEWFGGKVALFRAVHDSRAQTLSSRIAGATDFHDPNIFHSIEATRHEIVLVNWLIMNGSHFENLEDAFPSVVAAKEFIIAKMGLSEEMAAQSAQVVGSLVVADAMLRPHLNSEHSLFDLIVHYLEAISPKK